MKYNDTWDLNAMYQGGVTGQAFKEALTSLVEKRDALIKVMQAFDVNVENASVTFADIIDQADQYLNEYTTLMTYAQMASDADMRDEAASAAINKVATLNQAYEIARKGLNKQLATLSDAAFQDFLAESR